MTIDELKNYKRIYLLGYGIEGKATYAFLNKYCPDVEIGIGDEKLDPTYLEKQSEYDLIIKSPGIRFEKVQGTYTTATNIFFANSKHKTIGITGTKGKSTTATLAHNLLLKAHKKSFLAGNIGVPMLDILTNDIDEDSYIVLELSSYQLEDIAFSPYISVILNIYEELHNHSNFDEYRKAKFMIAQQAKKSDFLIYGEQLPELEELLASTEAQKIPLDEKIGTFVFDPTINSDSVKVLLSISKILHIDESILQETLDSHESLPHRLQEVGQFSGIRFINDSAANHPQATVHALHAIENVHTIILGGLDRGFDFKEVVNLLKEKKVAQIILFPNTQDKIANLLIGADFHPDTFQTESMEAAVEYAFMHTPYGSTCLLSPGAPSYLMFKGFPFRGEAFIQAIKKYAQENSES